MLTYYIAPDGYDDWSGLLPAPNAERSDGPLATLLGVRNRIRHRCQPPAYWKNDWQPTGYEGPITVYLREGIYPITETLVFGPEDSTPVTYTAYPGETPILDGGQRITGWREAMVHDRPCWVVDLPEVARGEWYFHSLFVHDERRPRPRLPKTDFYWIEDIPGKGLAAEFHEGANQFITREGDFQAWHNLTDVEVVALHFWNDEHLPVVDFNPATRLVTSSRRSIFKLQDDVQPRFAKYYLQNVFEALTEPGEWYLDRSSGRLYYLPKEGETPETTEIYAPRVTQLLAITGDAEHGRLVEHLRFTELTFRHSDAELPPGGWDASACNTDEDLRGWAADTDYASVPQAAYNVAGAISLRGARGCAIEGCTLKHLGWYALEIGEACRAIRLVANEMSDIGAGGVKVNGADVAGPRAQRTGDNIITDNHIHHAGRIFHQAVGIFLQHTFGNTVAHNHIHDLYYSGISSGWVWGFMDTVSRDNHIEYNHIHHLGFAWLSDIGGIYTLGVQPGSTIRGNLIHDVEHANYGGWGIYLDEGSSHIVVEDNVTYNTSADGFYQHYGRENSVRNNIFAAGRDGLVSLWRPIAGIRALTFQRNIVLSTGAPIYRINEANDQLLPGFAADYNLIWCVDGDIRCQIIGGDTKTLEEIRALGLDRHSVVADPLFVDVAGHDFSLAADSPAHALGIHPIDLSTIGPRPKDACST
jgi:parallel beta-helix repeat protein